LATITDVAALAGVSTATVSRVLNGKATVDPELAARVLQAARTLDYQPNGVARNLRRQATAVWALIIADIDSPFFTAIARGAEDVAQRSGYLVMLCNSDEVVEKEQRYLRAAVTERVAGVILLPATPDTRVGMLLERGIPVVAIDRPLLHDPADTVLVGSYDGARQATAHLLEQGYERVACITGPRGVHTAEERAAGYQEALREAGRPVEEALLRHADFRAAGGRAAMRALLPARPDALLVTNNVMVVGVLEALREAGRRPGPDLGMVCFDDTPWANLLDPPLSTVNQPAYEIGQVAGELLAARIAAGQDPPQPRQVTLPTELRIRASSLRHP
jgi:LacI family transcriptional regulator